MSQAVKSAIDGINLTEQIKLFNLEMILVINVHILQTHQHSDSRKGAAPIYLRLKEAQILW